MSEPWASLPGVLSEEISGCWRSVFPEGVPDWLAGDFISESDVAEAMARSLFLRQTLERYSEQIRLAITARPLTEPTTDSWLQERWRDYLKGVGSEFDLHVALRHYRREVQFRIIWRDLMKWADLHETMAATSAFADTAIDGALGWLYERACEEFGTPMGPDPVSGQEVPQKMVVLGMGKLGGRELNVSSDIDLIFAFPSKGETVAGEELWITSSFLSGSVSD